MMAKAWVSVAGSILIGIATNLATIPVSYRYGHKAGEQAQRERDKCLVNKFFDYCDQHFDQLARPLARIQKGQDGDARQSVEREAGALLQAWTETRAATQAFSDYLELPLWKQLAAARERGDFAEVARILAVLEGTHSFDAETVRKRMADALAKLQ